MLTALALYGAVVLAIGVLSSRAASRSEVSFLVGERSFGGLATWFLGAVLVAVGILD